MREIIQDDQEVTTPEGSADWHGTSYIGMHQVKKGAGSWPRRRGERLTWMLPHNAGLTDREWGRGRDSDAVRKACTMPGSLPANMTKVCVPKVGSDSNASEGGERFRFLQEG